MPQKKDLKVKIKKNGKEKLKKKMFDLSPNFWGIGAFWGIPLLRNIYYYIFLFFKRKYREKEKAKKEPKSQKKDLKVNI